jgi:hypothetical protein
MLPQAPSRSLRLPVLLDQQFWFLGHDIRHTAGNGLERYGFKRFRSADGVGTSCYLLPQAPGAALVCWGFGAYLGAICEENGTPPSGDAGTGAAGVLVQRHSVTPRLVVAPPTVPLHRLADLPRTRAPRSRGDWELVHTGLRTLAERFADYERWARRALGEPYRLDTLRTLPRHKRRRFEPVSDLSAYWERWRQ